MTADRPPARWGRKLLLLGGSVLFALVLIEVGLQAGALFLRAFREDPRESNMSGVRAGGEYRVLCLGESTTEGYGETPYPEILERLLNERGLGPRFRVINAGFVAEHSSFLLAQVEPLIAEHDPQMIIVMMGANDALYFSEKARLGIPVEWQLTLYKSRLYRLLSIAHHALRSSAGKGTRAYENPPIVPANRAHRWAFRRRFDETYERWSKGELEDAEARFRDLIRTAREVAVPLDDTPDGPLDLPPAYLFHYVNAYEALREILLGEGRVADAVELYEEATRRHPDAENFRRTLAGIYEQVGESAKAREQLAIAEAMADTEVLGITRANYRRLVDVLKDHDVVLVAMQYPLRRADHLKVLLRGSEAPIYVDNEAIFREAVAREGYDAYFVDRFAGDFGHCTARGNRLIAENLVRTVFEPLFAEGRAP